MNPRLLALLALLLSLPARSEDEEEEDDRHQIRTEIDFEALNIGGEMLAPSGAMLSATPGGAQDARYFRTLVEEGQIPQPEQITPEGLFSEHDLPVEGAPRCPRVLCAAMQAMPASVPAVPEVDHLAQLGFTSSLDAKSFQRPPLNLVVVLDRSGSMQGEPLKLVKQGLLHLAREELGPRDQLSIITFDHEVQLLLPATLVDGGGQQRIEKAVQRIEAGGSTWIEGGLELGFEEARRTRRSFDGATRVMLLTDAMPNVGDVSEQGFSAQARAAAEESIGLTTIGVGITFGAELAQVVSSTRGGNLYYFPDLEEMQQAFTEDFDLMVTELGWDLELEVIPARGVEIAGLWGIPGNAVERTEAGGLKMSVKTLFPSKKGGGILLGFDRKDEAGQGALAEVKLSFETWDGPVGPTREVVVSVKPEKAWTGLQRGAMLVDEVSTLRSATGLWQAGNRPAARQQVADLLGRLEGSSDPALRPEEALVRRLLGLMGDTRSEVDLVSGLPR